MLKHTSLIFGCVALTACASILDSSKATVKKLDVGDQDVRALVQKSDTRSDILYEVKKPTTNNARVQSSVIYCPAPMPDTATQVAASLSLQAQQNAELNAKRQQEFARNRQASIQSDENRSSSSGSENSESRNNEYGSSTGISGQLDSSYNTTVVELGGRTELVLAARDMYHSVCNMYANGAFTPSETLAVYKDVIGIVKDIALAEKADSETKKTVEETKKTEATAKVKEAEAKLKQAETAKLIALAAPLKEKREFRATRIIDLFRNQNGQFQFAEWQQFISHIEQNLQSNGTTAPLSSIFYNDLKNAANDLEAIRSVLTDQFFEDELDTVYNYLKGIGK